MFKLVAAVSNPTSVGNVPVKKLLPNRKVWIAVRFQTLAGTDPTMKLLDKSKDTSLANSPIPVGSALERKLLAKFKEASLVHDSQGNAIVSLGSAWIRLKDSRPFVDLLKELKPRISEGISPNRLLLASKTLLTTPAGVHPIPTQLLFSNGVQTALAVAQEVEFVHRVLPPVAKYKVLSA